jgi:hypothetical protein
LEVILKNHCSSLYLYGKQKFNKFFEKSLHFKLLDDSFWPYLKLKWLTNRHIWITIELPCRLVGLPCTWPTGLQMAFLGLEPIVFSLFVKFYADFKMCTLLYFRKSPFFIVRYSSQNATLFLRSKFLSSSLGISTL